MLPPNLYVVNLLETEPFIFIQYLRKQGDGHTEDRGTIPCLDWEKGEGKFIGTLLGLHLTSQ